MSVILSRVWAMPSPSTFTIKPIRDLINRHMEATPGEWIDPFCRDSSFKARCVYSNDLNPKFAGTHNMDALDFMAQFPAQRFDGLLFDPPFSPRQVKEEYGGFGADPYDTTRAFYSKRKREAARVLKLGGVAIVCGWNSLGLGKKNGMEIEEVLLVNHGEQNDTIVTVCRKIAANLPYAVNDGVQSVTARSDGVTTPQSAMDFFHAERRRQIEVEGWTPEHDDEHSDGEMLHAGVIYMNFGTEYASSLREDGAPMGWPWDVKWWKPKDRKANLIRAGALMLAEKERLGRIQWREALGWKDVGGQPMPARVYRPRVGMPTHHVEAKLAVAERELQAILDAEPTP